MQLGALSYLHRNRLTCVLHFYIHSASQCQGYGSIGIIAINNALGHDPIGSTRAYENTPFHYAVKHYAANNFAYTGPVLRGGLFIQCY